MSHDGIVGNIPWLGGGYQTIHAAPLRRGAGHDAPGRLHGRGAPYLPQDAIQSRRNQVMLPSYAELGTHRRNQPCIEFPGNYYIYHDGIEISSFLGDVGEGEALLRFSDITNKTELSGKYSLAWKASDNDIRIGSVWMTGYYTLRIVEV